MVALGPALGLPLRCRSCSCLPDVLLSMESAGGWQIPYIPRDGMPPPCLSLSTWALSLWGVTKDLVDLVDGWPVCWIGAQAGLDEGCNLCRALLGNPACGADCERSGAIIRQVPCEEFFQAPARINSCHSMPFEDILCQQGYDRAMSATCSAEA